MIPPSAAPADGLPVPRRYLAVMVIWLAMGMAVIDSAIVNTVLPTLSQELGASAGASIWIVSAYQLAIVVCLFPFSALGERLGYSRVYLGGLAIFIAASLACALSQGLFMLITARILQGVGAAGIMSINSALVRATYPQGQLGRGIGLNAIVIAVALAAGPTLASAILAVADWRWLFAVNIPFGVFAIAAGLRVLPTNERCQRPFDVTSTLLNAATFSLIVLGAESMARGDMLLGAIEVTGGLVAGAALVRREFERPFPLVPLDLLRIAAFRLSAATSFTTFTAQTLAMVALPFHLNSVLGRSAVEVGLLMTPWPMASAWPRPSPAGWPTVIRRQSWAAAVSPSSRWACCCWPASARTLRRRTSSGAWPCAGRASGSSSRPIAGP